MRGELRTDLVVAAGIQRYPQYRMVLRRAQKPVRKPRFLAVLVDTAGIYRVIGHQRVQKNAFRLGWFRIDDDQVLPTYLSFPEQRKKHRRGLR